jgi:hypothetical protein
LTAEAVVVQSRTEVDQEPAMSLPLTAAEVLRDHVTFELESIDRMYLNVYVPQLQRELGIVSFFRYHRSKRLPSGALMSPISRSFVRRIEEFAETREVPLIGFESGQRKEDIARRYRSRSDGKEGVYLIGKAQEKNRVCRTERRTNPQTGASYPWLVFSTAMVNQYYFYALDDDFGPFFLKFSSYFPYNAKLCLNGHEYLKRQLTKRGVGFEPLDNGLLSCEEPAVAQHIADELCAEKIDDLLRKWLRLLPHPFTQDDRRAGYRYQISMLQVEFALTQILDQPLMGRIFFENVIRENLDLGRPDRVALIFDRRVQRNTPGAFRTRVLTNGTTATLHVSYKDSDIKQYHKEGRGLRTEGTINNTRDFGVGKLLKNLPQLREIGFRANRRLLDVQRCSHDCFIGEAAFARMQRPLQVGGQRASALRFGDVRAQAVLNVLVTFVLHVRPFSSAEFKERLAALLGLRTNDLSRGQISYELRRLRLRGLIRRLPHSHRYEITPTGRTSALFMSRLYAHVLMPGLAEVADERPCAQPSPLLQCFRRLDQAVAQHARKLAA